MPELHNAIKFFGALQVAAKQALGVDDEGIIRVGETLTPVADLWRDEWAILRNARLWAGEITRPAGGAAFHDTAVWIRKRA